MKVALAEIEPWTFRGVCILSGSLGLMAMAASRGRSLAVPREDRLPLVAVSLLNVTAWQLMTAFALTVMDAGRASIVGFTMPLWAALMGVAFLGERLGRTRVAGLCLGVLGMAVLLGPDIERVLASPWGVLLMLGAALCWAGGTVLLKSVRWHMDTTRLAAWQLTLGGVPVLIGALVLGRPETLAEASATTWATTLYICLIPMIASHWAWFRIVELFPAGIAAIGTLAIPVVGVFGSALLLGERVGPPELVSLGLVVAGLFLVLVVPALMRRAAA
jgi:drug/metabolite transporter (DMT)-like permease